MLINGSNGVYNQFGRRSSESNNGETDNQVRNIVFPGQTGSTTHEPVGTFNQKYKTDDNKSNI